jgi:hypothetical protein
VIAAIYFDPLVVHPVIDGEWHRMRSSEIPDPGRTITMLCGASGTTSFRPMSERRSRGIPRQCARCDTIFRRESGIPLPKDRTSHR